MLITRFRHYNIPVKTQSQMIMTAVTFSCQNDADSHMSYTQYWENLVLIVVLISESTGL